MLQAHEIAPIVGRVAKRDPSEPDRPESGADHVGLRIRAAYEAAGYNRHSFANALGVAYTTLDSWEKDPGTKGAKAPKLKNVERVAKFLKLPMHVLTGEPVPTHVEAVWIDRAAWKRLEASGKIDAYRKRGVSEEQIQAARRYPFRGQPEERDYEHILDGAELNVMRQEAPSAREARERRAREGGPDLSDELKPR